MEPNEKSAEVLNDLLKINNDRVEGYVKAIHESHDSDLKGLFMDMADVSKKIAMSLTQEIVKRGRAAEVGNTTNAGKIYRVWMDVKAKFTGEDRESILNSCEFGEDAAQKAYKQALQEDGLEDDVRELIIEQKDELKEAHDLIRDKRDEAKMVKQ